MSTFAAAAGGDNVGIIVTLKKCADLPIADLRAGSFIPDVGPLSLVKDAVSLLPGGGESSSDPYVKVKLVNTTDMSHGEEQQSPTVHKDVNPVWLPPCRFTLLVPSDKVEVQRLVLDVWDEDKMSKDDYLGTTKLDLKGLELEKGFAQTFTLDLLDVKTGDKVPSAKVFIGVQLQTAAEIASEQHETVYEYERWTPTGGWGKKYPGHLLPSDPGCWSDGSFEKWSMTMEEVELPIPEGMHSLEHWVTEGDWMFGTDFRQKTWMNKKSNISFVRRRAWVRKCETKTGVEK
ncbi:hypothetical protein TrST_g12876 [Triparma strigata]|uniref:C2 domain-containing protein n=1 Tax=Triparma strigata TaxID=1606541 RepID=A0A9W6ZYP9_9STRA|nr:hypothetical protein TrST_g12876 [Triparma strigata]